MQWLIVHSVDAKLLAVKRVTTTEGRKTEGLNGQQYQAARGLKVRGYKAKPLRRIYIPKKNGKKRPLSIPTMKDRAMQTLYLLSLEPISETTGDLNSYGFRPKRSTHDAIQQCFSALGMDNRAQWILDADIQSCFDEISHQWLRENIMIDKRVLNQWLNSGFIEGNHLYETIRGRPQGGPISPMLANLVLDGLENAIHSACKKTDKVNFVRFADDFIVTAKTPDILNNNIIPVINQFLE